MVKELTLCESFVKKVGAIGGFENKVRYHLEDFFFREGWASHTNPLNGKEGFSHQWTYNYDTLRHFIEDFVRWSKIEFDKSIHSTERTKKGVIVIEADDPALLNNILTSVVEHFNDKQNNFGLQTAGFKVETEDDS